jgi:uncharacterized protein (DUF433 family)
MSYAGIRLHASGGCRHFRRQAIGRAESHHSAEIPAHIDGQTRRRRLDVTVLLALALVRSLPEELHLTPEDALRLVRQTGNAATVSIGDLVRIDAAKALADVRRRIALYDRVRDRIVCDPDIMGGTPTIRGTRITTQAILGRVATGDTIDSILEDYPYLDRETVEGAAVYAAANPRRGRPAGKPWRHAS